MSKFSELLSKPLPSAQGRMFMESFDEGCGSTGECGDGNNGVMNNLNTDLHIDSDMDTDFDSQDDTVIDPVDPINKPVEEPVTLTPEEDKRVDDVMNAVATPILIKDELKSEEEYKEFVESVDSDIAVAEGFLTEKTIVRLDKHAKKAQLYEVAVAACAKEHNDPLAKKLETVYKMERVIKAKLRKKYHAEANRKVKEYLARAKKSKSGLLSRIVSKITGK